MQLQSAAANLPHTEFVRSQREAPGALCWHRHGKQLAGEMTPLPWQITLDCDG